MAAFECTLCGRCCMHVGGELISIERRLSGRDFLCRSRVSGDTFRARVEEQYLDAFRDTGPVDENPCWCPFLRPKPGDEGRFICTIHSTRPQICQSYICCTMRIWTGDGRVAGKVKGRRSLDSGDPALRRCWEERVAPIRTDDDVLWRAQVKSVLEECGFRVEAYE